jgi:mycothiol system anti-sigma-R factor
MNDEPCRAVEHQLQAYLDRALTPAEVSMIEEHLGRCEYCRERYHFEAQLRDTVKTVCCGDPVPADLVDRVRLAIRDQSA